MQKCIEIIAEFVSNYIPAKRSKSKNKKMLLKIKSQKAAPFKNSDGDTIEYFWYKAIRLNDNVAIEFGSKSDAYEDGEEYEINVEKYERPNGKFGYKEVAGE